VLYKIRFANLYQRNQRHKKRKKYLWLIGIGAGLLVIGLLTGCDGTLEPTPTPTRTPKPTPTCTETAIPTATATATPIPSNWFSDRYGAAISTRARELVQLSNSGQIQILREMNSCWDIEQLSQITGYVCADVVVDTYAAAGINLQSLLLTSEVSSKWQYPCAAIHNAQAFYQYLDSIGQIRGVDDYPYYAGEILIGYPDQAHAAVVIEGGYDENSVKLVQASYGNDRIEETTLYDWKWREHGPQSFVWHGHPNADELNRIAP